MRAESPDKRPAVPSRSAVAVALLLGLGAELIPLPVARAAVGGDIVAVSSRVSADYVRTKLPDGSFPTETYAFGEGGHWRGPMRDDTIDPLRFLDVARTIAGPLADRNYLPAKDPKQLKLLIMVYWGTTAGPSGASSSIAYGNLGSASSRMAMAAIPSSSPSARVMALSEREAIANEFDAAMSVIGVLNRQRDKVNWRNAGILGYDSELAATVGLEFTALHNRRQDLIDDLEDNRYFVVLMAYDFQLLWKEKKHKLVWETRFSIRDRRHDFGKELAAMAKYASRYFGEDTHGLLRKPLPEGNVEIGELKNLGVVPEK
jgi:hypothetical protein